MHVCMRLVLPFRALGFTAVAQEWRQQQLAMLPLRKVVWVSVFVFGGSTRMRH